MDEYNTSKICHKHIQEGESCSQKEREKLTVKNVEYTPKYLLTLQKLRKAHHSTKRLMKRIDISNKQKEELSNQLKKLKLKHDKLRSRLENGTLNEEEEGLVLNWKKVKCQKCGEWWQRDINASLNILCKAHCILNRLPTPKVFKRFLNK